MNENKTNKINAINSMRTKINTKTKGNRLNARQWFKNGFVRFIIAVMIAALPILANAQTVTVDVGTGSDDLRGGNFASLTLILSDGSRRTRRLSDGLSGNSNSSIRIDFGDDRPFTALDIANIRIHHFGFPRPGNPFDTTDNWDLRSLRISLGSTIVYDSARDTRFLGSVVRFTDSFRILDIPLRVTDRRPDYVITQISPSGVRVENIGTAAGSVTQITCSVSGSSIFRNYGRDRRPMIEPGTAQWFPISVPSTRSLITCSVTGINETVTANNVFTDRIRF